jgi:hypothetical protein
MLEKSQQVKMNVVTIYNNVDNKFYSKIAYPPYITLKADSLYMKCTEEEEDCQLPFSE